MFWSLVIGVAAILGAIGVGLGAFGAHALKAQLSPEMLAVFETGAKYQMYHVMALVVVGLLATRIDSLAMKIAASGFFLGILLFSGSLYALALTGNRALGMITPIGGVFFIVGWLALAAAVLIL